MEDKTLAHYRITERLGAGGMGEVWKAVDTTLGRDVAIKILPDSFASNPERVARFEREARLLATVSHPGIAAIHGLHEAGGVRFLAMELVPGEDLSKRLERGPIPVDAALEIATHIAAALEAAHEKGIVHRDLKPANIIVGEDHAVKVLDFGLAKIHDDRGDSSGAHDLSQSPTMGSSPTIPGVILGTAAYMSPEQARGRSVDKRSDLWAFGCVLYEMLTGKAVFDGETPTDVLGAVLHKEPDWALLPPATPAAVRKLLRRCLEKDRRKRLRDAGDAILMIEDASIVEDAAPAPTTRRPAWVAIGASAVAGVILGALVMNLLKPAPDERPVRKFPTPIKDIRVGFGGGGPNPSPDGSKLAYVRNDKLIVRDLDQVTPREIETPHRLTSAGIEWSPDGQFICYDSEKRLWKVPAAGGPSVEICQLPETGNVIDLSWGKDGRIVFTAWRGGMYSVPAGGGVPDTLVPVDHEQVIDFHRVEHLPDGSLLFDAHFGGGTEHNRLLHYANGEVDSLGLDISGAIWSPTGHLIYTDWDHGPTLMGLPFSLKSMQPTGDAFVIARNAGAAFLTDGGLLVYTALAGQQSQQLAWVNRRGEVVQSIGEPKSRIWDPSLSPDGRRVAMDAWADDEEAVWIVDLAQGTESRLTFEPGPDIQSVGWSRDGRDILYARNMSLRSVLYRTAADGSTPVEQLFEGSDVSFTRDGGLMAYTLHKLDGDYDQWIAEVGAGGRVTPDVSRSALVASPLMERNGRVSPDGRYLLFEYGRADEREIMMTRFPSGQGRWQISRGRGYGPRWRHDGQAVFFRDGEDVLWEVSIDVRAGVSIGRPVRLFDAKDASVLLGRRYDVGNDGRFLVVRDLGVGEAEAEYQVVIVENWFEEFRNRR